VSVDARLGTNSVGDVTNVR